MSSQVLQQSDVIPAPQAGQRGAVSPRAQALADRLEHGVRALIAYAGCLSAAQWQARLPRDGRKVGVVVHHVASVFPVEIDLALAVAAGKPVEGLTGNDIDAMNARHAEMHGDVTKAETLDLLRRNSAAAVAAIRSLTDEELDRAAPMSLYGGAPLTCQFVLEDHPVRHSYHHLARIRLALQD